ncbi:major capsid protein [Aureimonas phyllosphaerae]|uniref:major capsid protein n=1 Tax=Aureimonas phyllosphaerae TaxID=1166078 RepID=UPI003A5B99B8
MATTRLTDVIYGPLFLPTTIQRIAQLSRLRNSPIVSNDPEIQRFANGPGDIVQMPFWNDLNGASNVSSDDPAQTAVPNKLTQGQDMARKNRRNNGWQSANLVAAVLAEDPLDVVAQLIAEYWVRDEETVLGQVVNGIFASSGMAGNKLDVASEAGATTPVKLDPEVAANAYALLGEYGQTLSGVLMHSRVYYNLRAQRAIQKFQDPVSGLSFDTWDDKRVYVSDACPRVAGSTSGFKYTSYLFGDGALAYAEATGEGGPKKPVEIESAASAGNGEGIETVWYRRHFVLHPRGIAFTGSPAGNSPTNAELANGSNWTRRYDPKLLRMVAVVTNG